MPIEITIPIQANGLKPALAEQRGMHGLLFAALGLTAPQRAAALHEQKIKPFTQALRPAASVWRTGGAPDTAGGLVWRVTLLEDDLYPLLWEGLAQMPETHILGQPVTLDLSAAQVQQESYARLATAVPCTRARLRFETPTAFAQRVFDQNIPDPYLCSQSWWQRWHAFAPAEAQINIALLDVVQAHVAVSQYRLASHIWRDGPRSLIGGVGEMVFVVQRPQQVDADWWRQWAALLRFARYCGSGHKTTQGLGQTRVWVEGNGNR